mgnify:CR=1 FL=1
MILRENTILGFKMTTLTKIKYSQLEDRFDSEYYRPEYLEIRHELDHVKNKNAMKDLFIIKDGDHAERAREFVKIGIRYLRAQDLKDGFIDDSESVFVSKEVFDSLKRSHIYPRDILFSIMGATDKISIYPEKYPIVTANRAIAILRVRNSRILNPYFVFSFLRSKYGFKQIIRNKKGGVQKRINLDDFYDILIPIPPQSLQLHIEKLVKEAFSKRKLAEEKYEQAKQLLEKELGLDKLQLKEEKTFEANFSNLNKNLRFDSEYYKPKYKQITEFLKNSGFEVRKLKDVVKISNEKIDPTKEPTKNFKYIEIGDVNISTGEISVKEIYGRDAPPNAKKILKEGDVIISIVRPTRGAITVIPTELNNSVGTSAFVVCGTEKPFREYLSIFLKSSLGLGQLEKPISSSMYPTIKEDDVKNLLIPILPKPKQEKISTLVRESFSLRKESKNLLEKSKKVVERAIENGTRK